MNAYRFAIGALALYLFVLASIHLHRVSEVPTDGTIYKDTPSSLYITRAIIADRLTDDSLHVGDLLLRIDDHPVDSIDHVATYLYEKPSDATVDLQVFRPSEDRTFSLSQAREQLLPPASFLRELPPSVYISFVLPEGPAGEAGIQEGDLLFNINGHDLAGDIDIDPVLKARLIIADMMGVAVDHASVADNLLFQAGVGDTLSYSVLRKDEIITTSIRTSETGYRPVLILLFFPLCCLLSGVWILSGRRDDKAQNVAWWLIATGIIIAFFEYALGELRGDLRTDYWFIISYVALSVLLIISYRSSWYQIGSTLLFGGFVGAVVTVRYYGEYSLFETTRDVSALAGLVLALPVDLATRLMSKLDSLQIPSVRFRRADWPQVLRKTDIKAPLILSFGLLLTLWLLHTLSPPPAADHSFFTLSGIRIKLFESGVIPFAILATFLFALLYLIQIRARKLLPISSTNPHNEKTQHVVNTGGPEAWTQFLNEDEVPPGSEGQRPEISANTYRSCYRVRSRRLLERHARDRDLASLNAARDDILTEDEDDVAGAFVPVRWCEIALPVLGFLGTVIGMGTAIGGLGNEIRNATTGDLSAGDLLLAFEGMRMAFDTTFLGLAGLLLVSLAQYALKKKLASALFRLRLFLDEVIERLKNESVVHELAHANEELAHVNLFNKTSRALTLRTIAETKHPILQAIKEALLAPIVQFQEVGKGLDDDIRQHVTEHLGDRWTYDNLGLPVLDGRQGVTAIRQGEQSFLHFFNVEQEFNAEGVQSLVQTPNSYDRLFPTRDAILAQKTSSGELVMLERSQPQPGHRISRMHETPFPIEAPRGVRKVIHVAVNKSDVALVIDQDGSSVTLSAWSFGSNEDIDPLAPQSLPHGFDWSNSDLWIAHASSGTFVAAGRRESGTWRVFIVPICSNKGRLDLETGFSHSISLPEQVTPSKLVALSREEILMLNQDGQLYYRSSRLPGFQPIRETEEVGWRPSEFASCRVWPGRDGWMAVENKGELRMWQIFQGTLHSNDRTYRFTVSGQAGKNIKDRAQVTANGKYLFTVAQDQLLGWVFPETAMDNLTQPHATNAV